VLANQAANLARTLQDERRVAALIPGQRPPSSSDKQEPPAALTTEGSTDARPSQGGPHGCKSDGA
jgi:hypothetical protein